MRVALAAVALALTAACGASPLEACVQHSLEEGVERDVAEQACRDAGVV